MNASTLPNYFNPIIMNGYITQAPNADEFSSIPDLICRIVDCFGNWLYAEKFTDYKAIPNFWSTYNTSLHSLYVYIDIL